MSDDLLAPTGSAALGHEDQFRDGLISIRPSPADGRSRLVELTEEGRRPHAQASPLWREAQRQFEQLNGAENVAELRRGLKRMVVGGVATNASDD